MIVGEYGPCLPGLNTRIGGASDIQGERDLLGTLERGRSEHRRSQRQAAIEIEFGATECRIKARWGRSGREAIGHASLQRLAIDLSFEPVNCNAFAAERDSAAAAHWAERRPAGRTAPLDPREENRRIAGVDLHRPLKLDFVIRRREVAAEQYLGRARGAQFERVESPSVGAVLHLATQRRYGGTTRHDAVDPEADVDRHRCCAKRGEIADQQLNGLERQPLQLGIRQQAIEVDLPGGQGGGGVRIATKIYDGRAVQANEPGLPPIKQFQLVDQHGLGGSLDLAEHLPRIVDRDAAVRERRTNDTRQRRGALKTGGAALDPECSVRFKRQRAFVRVDGKPYFHAAVLAAPTTGKSVGVVLALGRKVAFDFEWTNERSHLATQVQLFDSELGTTRGIGEEKPAFVDCKALDRKPIRIKAEVQPRYLHGARPVQPEPHFGLLESNLIGAKLAAHQGAEAELHGQPPCAHLLGRRCQPNLDVVEPEGGGGQKAYIDRPADPHRSPHHLAGLRFDRRTIFAPVDEKGPYERCNERQDNRYAETKKRRLQSMCSKQ